MEQEYFMSVDKFTVYILKFPNEKVYIGQTKNIKIRWEANGIHYKKNKEMYNDILKYGWKNIDKEILLETSCEDIAYNNEIKYIQLYNATNSEKGYNKSSGGKCSAKGVKMNSENKEALYSRLYGNKYHLGYKHSNESKQKMSKSKIGKHYSVKTEFPKRKVICVETEIIYESLTEAERKTGINHSHICQVCSKQRQTSGGFHWEYVGQEV